MKQRILLVPASCFTALVTVFAAQVPVDPPKPFTGKVVAISDGDTITVLHDKTEHKIRLNGIDAPESGQAFGTKAKKILGDKVFGQEVKVEWTQRDKYKRIIGEVYLGDGRMSLEMVAEGYAWHFTKYSSEGALAKAEKEAKDGKKGLWADANPTPPWDYRKGKGGEAPADTVFLSVKGTKYHRETCRLLKTKTPISLDEARKKYEPCGVCNPPP